MDIMNRQEQTFILSERQLAILQAVVDAYIATAQPVSSSAIADLASIHASPATVRNEMARLEELGLLLQPHTSAGRIPTDLGYRYYVDHLMQQYRQERGRLTAMPSPLREPGVAATCKLLGDLTRYTALALVPGWQEQCLQHIELAPVGIDQLLVMVVTDAKQVLHSLSTVPERPSLPRLRQLNDLLNSEFAGKPLSALTDEAVARAMAKLPHAPDAFTRQAPGLVRSGLEGETGGTRFYVEGTSRLFEQQDFSDMPKLRALMDALHEESVFERLFAQTPSGEIRVTIGTENPHTGLEDCAIVFTSYQISEHATGKVGVLGPKRMKYRQVIAAVDAVVHHLDQHLGTPK